LINLPSLNRFCAHLSIPSKEKGLTPLRLWGTQRYFLDKVCEGVESGIHFFYVLKARQEGITTINLALDLYWLFTHPGMQGTLVTEKTETLTENRSLLDGFYASLPRGLKRPIKTHNREILEFGNRSKLLYQVAGTKLKGQKNTLGQGKGINYCHGTEISSWGDPEATSNFIASLAESYPYRLYIFESTAKGMNDFQERWVDAKNSVARGTIFIGWWQNENYQVRRDDPDNTKRNIFLAYEGPPTGEEIIWCDQVRAMYGHEITNEQLAWWRWKLEEDIKDEQLMMQFYPPTEEHAFILSGYRFFDLEKIRKAALLTKAHAPEWFRYNFRATFDQTDLSPCHEKLGQLAVWEQPQGNGYYVVAADPAFGSSYEADRFCIQVFRCYTDRCEQVAEYCTTEGTTYAFAWVVAHLAGAYKNSWLIMEVNGPGLAVWQEIQRLLTYPSYVGSNAGNGLMDVMGNIRQYLWTRPDALTGNYAYHFKTTSETKELAFNQLRDVFERDQFIIKSRDLVEEMRYIQQDEHGLGSATRTMHDDRAMAAAMGVHCWQQQALPELFDLGLSYSAHRAKMLLGDVEPGSVLSYQLNNYLATFQRRDIQ
jgi:hypothetical protein